MSLRPLLTVLALAPVLLAAPRAYAEDQLGGGMIGLTLHLPPESGSGDPVAPSDIYRKHYFNAARCLCDLDAPPGEEEIYEIEYKWAGGVPPSTTADSIHIWSGQGCDAEPATRDAQCREVGLIDEPSDITSVPEITYRVRDLLLKPGDVSCPTADVEVQHWAVTQVGTTWNAENKFSLAEDITGNMRPPAVPTTITAQALEGGLTLTWTGFDADDDTEAYQALCAKADGSPVRATPPTRRYETTFTVCGVPIATTPTAAILTNPIGDPVGPPPTALLELQDPFLCGEAGPTASGITIDRLENDEAYWVVLVAVDEAGNYTGVYVDRPLVPREVIDFWEELNNENGNLRGGFCVAQVGADGALGSAVLVVLAGLIAVRRRRRGSRRAARLAVLALVAGVLTPVVFAPGTASAQATFSPYWLEEEPEIGFSEPTWTLGIRVGPYRPSIDDGFASNPGPYARTFKKDSVMVAADLHRVWSLLRGQLGVGFTAGYYGNSTNAFVQGSDPDDPDRPRAVGNTTSLRIVPLALTATYRATIFDDEMGIPLVPYARAGLAYDVWWIRAPSGELSSAMSCATCNDRALGATLGVVGAIGLAIRAERIDPDAARSMRDSGFEHAGFFAEIELSKVDGFGDEKRLSVGDTTWFGGINFEF